MAEIEQNISDNHLHISQPPLPKQPSIVRIFKEISKISQENKGNENQCAPCKNYVTVSGFGQYFKLPRIVSIQLYKATLDKKRWDSSDFEVFCKSLLQGALSQQTALIFAMLDFDGDGYVTRDDCHLLLSHTLGLPLNKTFEQVLASQNDIGEILDKIFKKPGQKFSFFQYRIAQQASDYQLHNEIYQFIRSHVNSKLESLVQPEHLSIPVESMPDYSPISNGGAILQWPLLKEKAKEYVSPAKVEGCGIQMQGHMYRLYQDIGLKSYFYKLKKDSLQVFRHKQEQEPKYIISLSPGQTLVTRKSNLESIDGQRFYKFSVIDGVKVRDFYHLKQELFQAWKEAIERVITIPKAVQRDYVLGEMIRKGRKSKVQKATHRKTNKVVVVKTISKRGLNEEELQSLRNEVQISKICKHSNLLEMIDVYEDEQNVYLVLQYMQGGNLHVYTAKQGKLNPAIIRGMLLQLASALYYLHNFNIVHRDLKTDNILLTGNTIKFKDLSGKGEVSVPEVKLADYGLSVAMCRNEKLDQPYGTMNFAAPQILSNQLYDEKIDMYSLGVTTYLLTCGHIPFQAQTVDILLEQANLKFSEVVNAAPSFSSSGFSGAPSQLISLIKKLLVKNPKKRLGIQELLTNKFLLKPDKDLRKERKQCKASSKFEVFTFY